MRQVWQLSNDRLTVRVVVEQRGGSWIVAEAAPMVRRFIGQESQALRRWMNRRPGFRAVRIDDEQNH